MALVQIAEGMMTHTIYGLIKDHRYSDAIKVRREREKKKKDKGKKNETEKRKKKR